MATFYFGEFNLMRLSFGFALLAVLACTGPAYAQARTSNATAITFERNSWGVTLDRWTFSAAGEVTLTERLGGPGPDGKTQTRAFKVTPADFERIRAMLAPTEAFVRKGLKCNQQITDAPYGSFSWTRPDGAVDKLDWNLGCKSTGDYRVFFDRSGQALTYFQQITPPGERAR